MFIYRNIGICFLIYFFFVFVFFFVSPNLVKSKSISFPYIVGLHPPSFYSSIYLHTAKVTFQLPSRIIYSWYPPAPGTSALPFNFFNTSLNLLLSLRLTTGSSLSLSPVFNSPTPSINS